MNKMIRYVSLFSILLLILSFKFVGIEKGSGMLENTNWRILSINTFATGKEVIWADFSGKPDFVLNFSKYCKKKNSYKVQLTTDVKGSFTKYYCQVKTGEIVLKNDEYKVRLNNIEKYTYLNDTDLYLPIVSALANQSGTYTLKNDTLILLGKANTAGNIKVYLVKK